MVSINFNKLIDENYTINSDEREQIVNVINAKVHSKEVLNIFCSFTFITPNNRAIFILSKLAEFAKVCPNTRIHIVLADMNILTQDYLKHLGFNWETDTVNFIQKKKDELRQYLMSFGASPEQIHVYNFSEVWEKMIKKEDKHYFLQYYSVISEFKLSAFDNAKIYNVSQFFQYSLDIFFATIMHILYPEYVNAPVDVFIGRFMKKDIYVPTRNLIYEHGISKMRKPFLLLTKEDPDLMFRDRIPEWNMDMEEIRYIIDNTELKDEDYLNIIEFYRSEVDKFNVYMDEEKKVLSIDQAVKMVKKESRNIKTIIVSSLIYSFLQEKKKLVKEDISVDNIQIKRKQDIIKISNLLKTKHVLEIIHLCDGKHTLTAVSKKLGIHMSNLSKSIKELKDAGIITIKDKKLYLNYHKVIFDFEN